jgi:serine/threonine protein kinase
MLEHLPRGTQLGTITLEQVLGRGGFGITYLGRLENGTKAAVKEFFPEGVVQRLRGGLVVPLPNQKLEFERLLVRAQFEAETLQLLKHESATAYHGTWQENGTLYMAMEFIQGQSLQQRIESGVKLREIEARAVLMACLGVLQELHGLGLLHRDIKPANIMLSPSRVELIDYGSAVKFKIGERIKRERLLTPMYAPLEQFGEEVQLTPATDFYALAATLYHALTQIAPPNALERARGAVCKPIRDLEPSLSPSLARVIDESLAQKLEERPHSATQVLNELRHGRTLNLPTTDPVPPTMWQSLAEDVRTVLGTVLKKW